MALPTMAPAARPPMRPAANAPAPRWADASVAVPASDTAIVAAAAKAVKVFVIRVSLCAGSRRAWEGLRCGNAPNEINSGPRLSRLQYSRLICRNFGDNWLSLFADRSSFRRKAVSFRRKKEKAPHRDALSVNSLRALCQQTR